MKIVFAKTRHHYDSYVDFWRLVEASRFETCWVDEIDRAQPCVYITTPWNGETGPALERSEAKGNAKIVWWNLERDLADAGAIPGGMFELVDAVWVSDRSYARIDPRLRFVVLGGHPFLGRNRHAAKMYDVCTLAYLWGRRQDVVDRLVREGVSVAPPAYGQQMQDQIVPASRLMLNMHQYDKAQIVAPLRFAVAASYHVPLLSEHVEDPGPLEPDIHFIDAPYDHLVDATRAFLSLSSHAQYVLALNLYERLTMDHRFDRDVVAAAAHL